MDGSTFVYYWLTFAVLVPVFSAVVFYLGRKAGYLKDQDRLRYLALWAEVPEETKEKSKNRFVTTGPDKSGHTDRHRQG